MALSSFILALLFTVAVSLKEVNIQVHQRTHPEQYKGYSLRQTSTGGLIIQYETANSESVQMPRLFRTYPFQRSTRQSEVLRSSMTVNNGVKELQFSVSPDCSSYQGSYPYSWSISSYERLCSYIIWFHNPYTSDQNLPIDIKFSSYSTSFDIILPTPLQGGAFYTDVYERQRDTFNSMLKTSDLCSSYSSSSAFHVDDLQVYCHTAYPTTMTSKYLVWSCSGSPTIQIMPRKFLLNEGSCETYPSVPTSVIGYYQTAGCKATLVFGETADVNIAIVIYDGSRDKALTRIRSYGNSYSYQGSRSDDSWIGWVAILGFCCCLFVCAGIIHNRSKQQSTAQPQVTPLVQMEEVTPQVQLHQSTFGAQQYQQQQQPVMGMPVNQGYGYGSQYKL